MVSSSAFPLANRPPSFLLSPSTKDSRASDGSSMSPLCAVRSRPPRPEKTIIRRSPTPPAASPPPKLSATSPEKKRHWKAGEFPGVSDDSIVCPPRTPIKNIKKKLDARAAAKAWVCSVTEVFAEKIRKQNWMEALEVFEMLREQPFYYPKEGTYMKLIVLLGKSGQASRAHQLFDEMSEEGIEPTLSLYTALLSAYCRCNLLDEAFSILSKMKELPLCQPDVFTYSTLLKACVDTSRFDLVNSLYQEMKERAITPTTVTQNIVLGGYGKAGFFSEMESVLSGMLESKDCKPDVWSMNIILGVFANKREVDLMEKWYERFRDIGIEPETRTFNIMISAYGKKRMYEKMTAVLEYMRRLRYPWTTSTYNNVIEAFSDAGDSKNMEFAFDQMRAEGMRPDTKTFCCLIDGFGNAGLFHKVVSSIQLAEKLGVVVNVEFFNAVISACSKAGDLLEMERVFLRMKSMNLKPNSSTYLILSEAYEKEGMNDKVYELEKEKQMSGL